MNLNVNLYWRLSLVALAVALLGCCPQPTPPPGGIIITEGWGWQ